MYAKSAQVHNGYASDDQVNFPNDGAEQWVFRQGTTKTARDQREEKHAGVF
jgi:hypothetical protein